MYAHLHDIYRIFVLLVVLTYHCNAYLSNIRLLFTKTMDKEESTSNISDERCTFDERCLCKNVDRTIVADCSRKKIDHIPRISSDIFSINLSNNMISSIPENIFQSCTHLHDLDLSYNNISIVQNGSFNGLDKLRSLKLNGNIIRYKDNAFGRNSFRPLINLRALNIENNIGFYTAGQTYPTLSDLSNLEALIIDGVDDESLGEKLHNLTNLKSIRISNFTGICAIEVLKSNVFNYTPSLETIEITGCPLRETQTGIIGHLKHLTTLNISHNIFLHFNGAANILQDIQFTSIKILKINKIYETFHLNTVVPLNLLKLLKNTSLEELEIESNRIQIVESGGLTQLPPTLSRLSAADNSFSYAPYLFETLNLTIKTFNISNLYATHIYKDGTILKRHVISALFTNEGYATSLLIPMPKHIQKMFINKSVLRFFVPSSTLLENNLEHIDFSENLVTPWIGPVYNTRKLKHVDFSQNFCSNVSKFFFIDMINIETLLLNNNLLGFIIPEDKEGKILASLSKLKHLDLSQNRISFIPLHFFKSQASIETLDLSNNLLSNVTFAFEHMHELKLLDLSYNQIQYLSSNILEVLDFINNHGNLTVKMRGNPIVCNCESIAFLKWMETYVNIDDLRHYKCSKHDGTKKQLKLNKETYQILLKECSNFGYLIVGISICVLVFLIVVASGIVYRFRWKLRYAYYMTRQKYRGYNVLPNGTLGDYLYDAFVSFADEDQAFVHGAMTEQLENSYGYKLCLHIRDFQPGKDIAENITNAIHKSNKTVVVVSENFLKSYWCMYEFNMARMESIYAREGENILFMILLEKIPAKDLPLQMLELIQSETYIEYPTDDLGTEIFWMKIKEALTM